MMMGKLFRILQHLFVIAILLSSIVQYHHHISYGKDTALCLLHLHGESDKGCGEGNSDDLGDDGCPLHLAKVCRLQGDSDLHFDKVPVLLADASVTDDFQMPVFQPVITCECFYVAVACDSGCLSYDSLRAPPAFFIC